MHTVRHLKLFCRGGGSILKCTGVDVGLLHGIGRVDFNNLAGSHDWNDGLPKLVDHIVSSLSQTSISQGIFHGDIQERRVTGVGHDDAELNGIAGLKGAVLDPACSLVEHGFDNGKTRILYGHGNTRRSDGFRACSGGRGDNIRRALVVDVSLFDRVGRLDGDLVAGGHGGDDGLAAVVDGVGAVLGGEDPGAVQLLGDHHVGLGGVASVGHDDIKLNYFRHREASTVHMSIGNALAQRDCGVLGVGRDRNRVGVRGFSCSGNSGGVRKTAVIDVGLGHLIGGVNIHFSPRNNSGNGGSLAVSSNRVRAILNRDNLRASKTFGHNDACLRSVSGVGHLDGKFSGFSEPEGAVLGSACICQDLRGLKRRLVDWLPSGVEGGRPLYQKEKVTGGIVHTCSIGLCIPAHELIPFDNKLVGADGNFIASLTSLAVNFPARRHPLGRVSIVDENSIVGCRVACGEDDDLKELELIAVVNHESLRAKARSLYCASQTTCVSRSCNVNVCIVRNKFVVVALIIRAALFQIDLVTTNWHSHVADHILCRFVPQALHIARDVVEIRHSCYIDGTRQRSDASRVSILGRGSRRS